MEKLINFLVKLNNRSSRNNIRCYQTKDNKVKAWQFSKNKTPLPPWIQHLGNSQKGYEYAIPGVGSTIPLYENDWIIFREDKPYLLYRDREFSMVYKPFSRGKEFLKRVGQFFLLILPVFVYAVFIDGKGDDVVPQIRTVYKKVRYQRTTLEERLSNVRCTYSDSAVVCRDCSGIRDPSDCLLDSFAVVPWSKHK